MKTLESATHSSEHSSFASPPPKHGECKSFDQDEQPDLDPGMRFGVEHATVQIELMACAEDECVPAETDSRGRLDTHGSLPILVRHNCDPATWEFAVCRPTSSAIEPIFAMS